MSGTTSRHKLPYPTAGDPIYQGAAQIQALAEAIDPLIGSGGATASGTVTPEPGTLVQRDTAGRTQVSDPIGGLDAANRQWTQSQGYATQTYVDQAIQDAELGGNDGGSGSATPESVTATAGSLALRDSAGRTQVAAPSAAADAANKGYVDTNITNKGYITSSALSGYATQTYVDTAVAEVQVPSDVVRQSTIEAMRSEMFGGASRTKAPLAEIALSSNVVVPGNSDQLAGSQWTALVDTDNGLIRSGTWGQTRYQVPVTGRYLITYQLMHQGDNGAQGGAMKILRNGTDVLKQTIASRTATPSLEGPTMMMAHSVKLTAGDAIRWGYWYSGQVTQLVQGFGTARSKIVIQYTGSV